MPQSFSSGYLHLVFGTKHRRTFLDDPLVRKECFSYLAGISQQVGFPPVVVNGMPEHVHILAKLSRTETISNWVKKLKLGSGDWLRDSKRIHDFHWQSGYAVFTVDNRSLSAVSRYVREQEEHHRTKGFEEEYLELLQEHEIEWDPRYVWD